MSRYLSAEEVEKENLETLGPNLGPAYHELCNECAWLHIKWHQYLVLYGTKPERIDLLNRSASLFFNIVEKTLWHDTLLHLTRLTAPPKSRGRDNLTIQRLPCLIEDTAFRAEIENLVSVAIESTPYLLTSHWLHLSSPNPDDTAIRVRASGIEPSICLNVF